MKLRDQFKLAPNGDMAAVSPEGTVWLVFHIANEPEEEGGPEPIRRANLTIEYGLRLAESRGFKHSKSLLRCFCEKQHALKQERWLNELFRVVSAEEFLSASGIFSDLFHTTH